MKQKIIASALFLFLFLQSVFLMAQCSMCTKTAQQLGEKPALGLNQGILYLMFTPFVVMGIIAYRWWKGQQEEGQDMP